MKIGVITIHKILNYGSALQAYALQYYMSKAANCRCEIIDYTFPNEYHIKNRKYSIGQLLKRKLHFWKLRLKPSYNQMRNSFAQFWEQEFNLSDKKYKSRSSIIKNPPKYDFLVTGSDQVWNTKSLSGDDVFMLAFCKDNTPRISYAASFGIKSIDTSYYLKFKNCLQKYQSISIREDSALEILKDMGVDRPATVTCDPTLLLSSDDYDKLAVKSKLRLDTQYILVYYLSYAFNPMPGILNTLNYVYDRLGYHVVFLNNIVQGFKGSYSHISNVGPYDFIFLVKNASYIITSSFHGTAFSIIYRKPFKSISPRLSDGRISELLRRVGLECNIQYADDNEVNWTDDKVYTGVFEQCFLKYVKTSKHFIQSNLNVLKTI